MLRSFLRTLAYAAFYSIGFLILTAIDPFKVDQAVDQQARDILYRAFAPNYNNTSMDLTQFCVDLDEGEECEPETAWSRSRYLNQPEETPTTPNIEQTSPTNEHSPFSAQNQIVTVHLSDIVLRSIRKEIDESLEESQLTDEELKEEKLDYGWYSWRPTYRDQADLVSNISYLWHAFPEDERAAAKPPAIFFDFIFVEDGGTADAQEGFEAFKKAVKEVTAYEAWKNLPGCEDPMYRLGCIKEAGGIPLIFAKAQPRILLDSEDESPAQQALDQYAILAPVRFVGNPGDYPITTNALTDREYQQFREINNKDIDDHRPTPAVLMYLAWCMDHPGHCGKWIDPNPTEASSSRYRRIVQNFSEHMTMPISVKWGSSIPDYYVGISRMISKVRPELRKTGFFADNTLSFGEGEPLFCRYEPSAMSAPLKLLWRQILSNRQEMGPGNLVQPCRYHLEVPYDALASQSRPNVLVKSLFNGRIIIVGAQFRNSADLAWSPVHGQVPGLHGHAMATDNLLEANKHYLRSVPKVGWIPNVDWLDIFETFVMFALILIVSMGQWWLNHRMIQREQISRKDGIETKAPGHTPIYVIVVLSIVTFVLFAILLQVKVFHWAPMNWISVIIAAVLLFGFLLRDEISDDLKKFFTTTRYFKRAGVPALRWLEQTRLYLDMETVGFEEGRSLKEARLEKNRVTDVLYSGAEKQVNLDDDHLSIEMQNEQTTTKDENPE